MPEDPSPQLTERQREVLSVLSKGKTNREIAEALSISEATVESHLHEIFGRIEVKNRTAAAFYAFQHGLLQNTGNP